LESGLVIKSTGSWYYVRNTAKEVIPCKIKGTWRIRGLRSTNPVAVGDNVDFLRQSNEATGVIQNIGERKNYIVRKSPNLSRQYQLIASNVDQVLLMASLVNPRTHLEFIDRILVAAESYRIPVAIIFNKIDLYNDAALNEWKYIEQVYNEIGYQCFDVSVLNGVNMNRISGLITGKRSLLTGNSGVGKSTLLNTLDPSLGLKTANVSSYHQSGRHTTTFAEMHLIGESAEVIDTPGIKGFGMIEVEKEELFHFFPEIFKISKACKFHNCLHLNEPHCAVVKAVDEDIISPSRYLSYINMMGDTEAKYRM